MKSNKYLDKEEKLLIESYEKIDKSKQKKPTNYEQTQFKKAAKEYLKNEAKMNIRIDPNELKLIKLHAAQEGLKYQTYVKSILHKYITGQLKEIGKQWHVAK